MNRFQANPWMGRFLIVFGVSTLLALFLLFSARSNLAETKARFDETVAERNRLERRDPFPSEVNYAKLKAHLDNYGIAVTTFEEELKNHTLPATPLAPNEFQTRLRQAMVASAEKARANKVKVPNNFALGFEEFTAALPSNEAAPLLGQELAQVELLANVLIEARVDSVTAFARRTLPSTTTATFAPTTRPAATPVVGLKIVERNIVDLTFVAPPSAARKVLNQISSLNQQLCVIRALHVSNEKEKGPAREGSVAGVAAMTATSAPANTALNFIVGNEHIETSVRIEMPRFNF
jgi:hypothetical protein